MDRTNHSFYAPVHIYPHPLGRGFAIVCGTNRPRKRQKVWKSAMKAMLYVRERTDISPYDILWHTKPMPDKRTKKYREQVVTLISSKWRKR